MGADEDANAVPNGVSNRAANIDADFERAIHKPVAGTNKLPNYATNQYPNGIW